MIWFINFGSRSRPHKIGSGSRLFENTDPDPIQAVSNSGSGSATLIKKIIEKIRHEILLFQPQKNADQ